MEEITNNNTEFGFWDKLKYIFSDPDFFFEKVKSEQGIGNSLLMYIIAGVFMAGIGLIFYFVKITSKSGGDGYEIFHHFFMFIPFIVFIIGIIFTFLYSGLIHVIIIAFKGDGNYSDSYNVYAYSMVPFLILIVVPMVGFLSIIYSFILMIIGISKVHNISKGKAALACLLPVFSVIILLIWFLRLPAS